MEPSQIVPLAIAALVVIIFIGYAFGKKRSEAFHRFARRRGMSYAKKADFSSINQLKDLQLVPHNLITTVSNVIKGEVDSISVMLCDLRTSKGTGNVSMPMHKTGQTIVVLQSRMIDLPSFTMHPANIFHKAFRTIGKQNIPFHSHDEFSDTYTVSGDNENAVREKFHDQAIAYFLNHKGRTMEGSRDRLLYFRSGKFIKPEELNSFLTEALEVFRFFA